MNSLDYLPDPSLTSLSSLSSLEPSILIVGILASQALTSASRSRLSSLTWACSFPEFHLPDLSEVLPDGGVS